MQPLGKEHFNSLKKGCYIRPFEGNLEADVAPGENEFDTPALDHVFLNTHLSVLGNPTVVIGSPSYTSSN